MNVISLPRGAAYISRAEDVYPTLEPGSVSMVWSDGPYAVGKDTWDRMKPADLPAWYEPHIEAWGRICALSASVYHWGTADGWARVHPVYLAAGWRFRGLIVWEKTGAHPAKIGAASATTYPDVTEVAGYYQRGSPPHTNSSATNVWKCSPTDDPHHERIYAETLKAHRVTGAMQRIAAHPCQKPLMFVRRAILASTRPGNTILDPFAGTCRVALACEQLHADQARRHVSIEMDPAHVKAALRDIDQRTRQGVLF